MSDRVCPIPNHKVEHISGPAFFGNRIGVEQNPVGTTGGLVEPHLEKNEIHSSLHKEDIAISLIKIPADADFIVVDQCFEFIPPDDFWLELIMLNLHDDVLG